MVGKLIVYGDDRDHCIRRLKRCLAEMALNGVETTIPLFRDLIEQPEFLAGDYHIHWLEEWLAKDASTAT
jgi:acetyl-CoA carboxylase biotin carboxylase subunit